MVWINAGHEIFQEARAKTTTLLEQAITGYHEGNDIVYAMSHPKFASGVATAKTGGSRTEKNEEPGRIGGGMCTVSLNGNGGRIPTSLRGAAIGSEGVRDNGSCNGVSAGGGGRGTFEDSYIDNVLGAMGDLQAEARHREEGESFRSSGGGGGGVGPPGSLAMDGSSGVVRPNRGEEEGDFNNNGVTEMGSAWDGSVGEVYGSSWEHYRSGVAAAGANAAARGARFGYNNNSGYGIEAERMRCDGERGGDARGANSSRKGRRRHGEPRGDGGGGDGGDVRAQGRSIMVGTVLDASHPAFERQNNLVYGFGQGSKVYPQPEEFPEVRGRNAWLRVCVFPIKFNIFTGC